MDRIRMLAYPVTDIYTIVEGTLWLLFLKRLPRRWRRRWKLRYACRAVRDWEDGRWGQTYLILSAFDIFNVDQLWDFIEGMSCE